MARAIIGIQVAVALVTMATMLLHALRSFHRSSGLPCREQRVFARAGLGNSHFAAKTKAQDTNMKSRLPWLPRTRLACL